MGWRIGDETLSIELLPGRKRKSLNLWIHNEYISESYPLAYFRTDEDAETAERFLEALAGATLLPEVK